MFLKLKLLVLTLIWTGSFLGEMKYVWFSGLFEQWRCTCKHLLSHTHTWSVNKDMFCPEGAWSAVNTGSIKSRNFLNATENFFLVLLIQYYCAVKRYTSLWRPHNHSTGIFFYYLLGRPNFKGAFCWLKWDQMREACNAFIGLLGSVTPVTPVLNWVNQMHSK